MLTAKGQLTLALGGLIYLIAWLFGSEPLYPVGIGLVVAVALSALWVRVLSRPRSVHRRFGDEARTDGDDVDVDVGLRFARGLPPPWVSGSETVAGLGEFKLDFARVKGGYAAHYRVDAVPRGRYAIDPTTVVTADPFGFAVQATDLRRGSLLLVYPRLVELEALFSETGSRLADGRRLLLRRQTGYDSHSVREYEEGESLRRVHWPTSARRGKLMVKELEDAPRDEALVVLDGEETTALGVGRDSSFEVAVRAAGSIARAHAARGQRAGLLVNDRTREYERIQSLEGDWPRALKMLACAQPTGRHEVATLLEDGAGPAANALDLTVVTSSLSPRLTERLARRAAGRRGTAVVLVEARSFDASVPPDQELPADVRASMLRLGRAGVPIAVLRRGDDLLEVLGGESASEGEDAPRAEGVAVGV